MGLVATVGLLWVVGVAGMPRPRPAFRRRAVKRLVMTPAVREPLGERASNRLTAKPAGQGLRGCPPPPTPGGSSRALPPPPPACEHAFAMTSDGSAITRLHRAIANPRASAMQIRAIVAELPGPVRARGRPGDPAGADRPRARDVLPGRRAVGRPAGARAASCARRCPAHAGRARGSARARRGRRRRGLDRARAASRATPRRRAARRLAASRRLSPGAAPAVVSRRGCALSSASG